MAIGIAIAIAISILAIGLMLCFHMCARACASTYNVYFRLFISLIFLQKNVDFIEYRVVGGLYLFQVQVIIKVTTFCLFAPFSETFPVA